MAEIDGTDFLTGDMVPVLTNNQNDQVISGFYNYGQSNYGNGLVLDMGLGEKTIQNNAFLKSTSSVYNHQNVPLKNKEYKELYGSQCSVNKAENVSTTNIKPENLNITHVHSPNGSQFLFESPTRVKILPPKKEKNPQYVTYENPEGDVVTAKRKAPVRMDIDMPQNYNCEISLRYKDLMSMDTPVTSCNTHHIEVKIDADPRPMFLVKGHKVVEYFEDNRHPSFRITSKGEYILQPFCWNSCEQNRKNKKEMSINVKFSDKISGLCTTKEIILRVAENVKRDAGIIGPARARKRSINEESSEHQAAKMIHINEELEAPRTLTPQPIRKKMLCIQVDSEADIVVYESIAKRLGNEMNIIPVDENVMSTLPDDENLISLLSVDENVINIIPADENVMNIIPVDENGMNILSVNQNGMNIIPVNENARNIVPVD